MNLEKQVCSLELAKKLKEFGAPQESYFWWTIPEGGNEKDYFVSNEDAFGFCEQDTCSFNHGRVSAYTVVELGELLPVRVNFDYWIRHEKEPDGKSISMYIESDRDGDYIRMSSDWQDTEANARAKMLVYLLENKLIEV